MSDIDTSPTAHDPKLIRTTLEGPLLSNVPAPARSVAQSPAVTPRAWLVRQMKHAFRIYKRHRAPKSLCYASFHPVRSGITRCADLR